MLETASIAQRATFAALLAWLTAMRTWLSAPLVSTVQAPQFQSQPSAVLLVLIAPKVQFTLSNVQLALIMIMWNNRAILIVYPVQSTIIAQARE